MPVRFTLRLRPVAAACFWLAALHSLPVHSQTSPPRPLAPVTDNLQGPTAELHRHPQSRPFANPTERNRTGRSFRAATSRMGPPEPQGGGRRAALRAQTRLPGSACVQPSAGRFFCQPDRRPGTRPVTRGLGLHRRARPHSTNHTVAAARAGWVAAAPASAYTGTQSYTCTCASALSRTQPTSAAGSSRTWPANQAVWHHGHRGEQ